MLNHAQQQQQVVFEFRPSAAGQEGQAPSSRQGRGLCQHWIHEGVADKTHRPTQLLTEILRREQVSAEDGMEPFTGQTSAAGPGQIEPTFVMAGVGHQVGGRWPSAEPGGHHRNDIADHHHEVVATTNPQQPQQGLQQMRNQQSLKHLDDPIANDLFISIIELMEYFCLESERTDDQNHLFDEISQSLNQNHREEALFNCLAIPDDSVRLAVVRCLYVVPLDEFDSEEIERITSIVTTCNNIAAGETELILSTIYWICTKFVTPSSDDSASTSSTTIFINKFGEQTVNEALDILAKNLERVAEQKDDK